MGRHPGHGVAEHGLERGGGVDLHAPHVEHRVLCREVGAEGLERLARPRHRNRDHDMARPGHQLGESGGPHRLRHVGVGVERAERQLRLVEQ